MDPNARYVVLPFEQDGKHGNITLSLGTALALGFTQDQLTANTRQFTVAALDYVRSAYIGGPTIPVHRSAQEITRQIGSASSGAKTNKKLRLRLGADSDTIYFTGPVHSAVKWLQLNIKTAGVAIANKSGKVYSISLAAPAAIV